jgi:hypothetical protein
MSTSQKSYLSFTSDRIASNLNALGVGLGRTDADVQVAVRALKRVEVDRVVVALKGSCCQTDSELNDEDDRAAYDGPLLSHLVGDVSEVGLDDDGFVSLYELKASARRSKSSSNKKTQKPSKRTRTTKSPTVSS